MTVTSIAGGVGAAKLLIGLDAVVLEGELTAVVNTGDDAVIYGVHVSPDVDMVTYWLAGVADTERGWGLLDDTFTVVDQLRSLGAPAWFGLGDRDFATCIYRTQRLDEGASLSDVAEEIRRRLGVRARIIPATDDRVRTRIVTTDGRTLDFQEYFVKERQEPEVADVLFDGIADAKPAPGVVEAVSDSDLVVVCPSNPILSIGPILALPGVRDALRAHPRVLAVSPIVRGAALKGPADRILNSMGISARASKVAGLYSDFIDIFVVDASDPDEQPLVESLGIECIALDTIMSDLAASRRLAESLMNA